MMLFAKIGIIPGYNESISKARIGPNNKIIEKCIRYQLFWIPEKKHKNYLEDDEFFYIPIKSIKRKLYKGKVYNIETSDHTYCVLPFIVHNCCAALPGSPLYLDAKKYGWELPKTYEAWSFHSYECQPLPTKYLTAAEVLRFRDKAWEIYFKNPAYLSMIEKKFGQEAVDSVKEMTKIKLKRKLLGD